MHSNDFTLLEVFTLQIIRQNKTEENEKYIASYITDEMLDKFKKEGLISTVKKKIKSDSHFSFLRTTKKANDLIDNCETPEITQGDVDMFNYLTNMYLTHEDEERTIGNKKKTKIYCAVFRNRMNLSLHQMYWLCWFFLQEYTYTKKLQNVFFDENKHRYGKFGSHFEDSPLYQFLDERRKEVEQIWAKNIKNER